ncbi:MULTISPECIES: tRNA (adenosine(37)-N6)-threonylcarbamoyltransferase complex dimerization subunit type 1 TsaB [Lentibacter]|uniref:tRNA threonylcarbamoyl adenosine modification protein YeaZ n=1 Tax=Lentibacter algarum TaxID=576131 RepID=A0A1H3HUH1_9RHOB|nr:tRNA (adenosine(37)-N6)-threonylcarbamoyltransferase complex dimerization subunit type 1 TsaB [Lentibacter algarum]MCO4826576.1 tRNA (adenosine(37)-N6)-threonylcarbamoyltransferase complex dimerization subunit type 1 TsaB [Lentibacter algarum]WIF31121.1 putative peptidase M22 [Lentibacter algarum]SDY18885.1 tRNA threonylcarbamoyl adenosine modification protein YeaZ [Lentibacter algarum]
MPSETLTLAFDTSAAHCAAALLLGEQVLGTAYEPMKRGQSERLFVFLEELLAEHGHTWQDLNKIGVGVGPGNFTGIRIAVSAARGLAMSLDISAVGVSNFAAARLGADTGAAVALPAPRDQVYFSSNGDEAKLIDSTGAGDALGLPAPDDLVERIARIAAATDATTPPAPLYIRAADAAPAADQPPRILDDA